MVRWNETYHVHYRRHGYPRSFGRPVRAIELIRKVCKPRKQMIPMTPMLAAEESIIPVDVMVRLGGATVFVMDVAEHYKI